MDGGGNQRDPFLGELAPSLDLLLPGSNHLQADRIVAKHLTPPDGPACVATPSVPVVTNLVGVPHLQPGDLPLCQLPPTRTELQEVHSKLDTLLLRIPHIPAVPGSPLAMLPPPALPHTRVSSDASGQLYTTVMATAPPPYSPPSHALLLDGLPTLVPVPISAPQFMVHEKSRTLRLGSGHIKSRW